MSIRDEAQALLDAVRPELRRDVRLVLTALLEELAAQDELLHQLRQANASFGESFDRLLPTVVDSVRRAHEDGKLEGAGVLTALPTPPRHLEPPPDLDP